MCEFGKRGGDIAKYFAIDMLFEYEEDDGSTLMWCQGKVVDFIRESKENHVFVKIEWSDKCVREGDLKITKNQLKRRNGIQAHPLVELGERIYIIS